MSSLMHTEDYKTILSMTSESRDYQFRCKDMVKISTALIMSLKQLTKLQDSDAAFLIGATA